MAKAKVDRSLRCRQVLRYIAENLKGKTPPQLEAIDSDLPYIRP